MKRYKLLKDTPSLKVGMIFELHEDGRLFLREAEDCIAIPVFQKNDIDKFNEWFVEIKATDWKPKEGDEYWTIYNDGSIDANTWRDDCVDKERYNMNNCYHTEEDAKYAKELQIARTIIKRSSDFVPDWNDVNQGKWYVVYHHQKKRLLVIKVPSYVDSGAIAYYRTDDDARQAMEDLEPEYLLYFGIDPSDTDKG